MRRQDRMPAKNKIATNIEKIMLTANRIPTELSTCHPSHFIFTIPGWSATQAPTYPKNPSKIIKTNQRSILCYFPFDSVSANFLYPI